MSWLNRSIVSADFEYLFWLSSAANSAIFASSSNPCLSFSATSSLSLFGILFSTAQLKWTWHICQVAPKNLDETALCIPIWPSETTSLTPFKPRSFSSSKNPDQNPSLSLSVILAPRTSRYPSSRIPVMIRKALVTYFPPSRTLK